MALLHPDRVAAAWLRSGVPLLKPVPERPTIKPFTLPDAALRVPVMCNLGTKEGVTVKDERFAGVWPANEVFFQAMRARGALIGVAIDPLSSHECGNQRFLAIPWLDACLSARLPKVSGAALRTMPADQAWLAPIAGGVAAPAARPRTGCARDARPRRAVLVVRRRAHCGARAARGSLAAVGRRARDRRLDRDASLTLRVRSRRAAGVRDGGVLTVLAPVATLGRPVDESSRMFTFDISSTRRRGDSSQYPSFRYWS